MKEIDVIISYEEDGSILATYEDRCVRGWKIEDGVHFSIVRKYFEEEKLDTCLVEGDGTHVITQIALTVTCLNIMSEISKLLNQ